MSSDQQGVMPKLSILMFIQFFIWGTWYLSVSLYMYENGMGDVRYYAYTAGPLGAIIARASQWSTSSLRPGAPPTGIACASSTSAPGTPPNAPPSGELAPSRAPITPCRPPSGGEHCA